MRFQITLCEPRDFFLILFLYSQIIVEFSLFSFFYLKLIKNLACQGIPQGSTYTTGPINILTINNRRMAQVGKEHKDHLTPHPLQYFSHLNMLLSIQRDVLRFQWYHLMSSDDRSFFTLLSVIFVFVIRLASLLFKVRSLNSKSWQYCEVLYFPNFENYKDFSLLFYYTPYWLIRQKAILAKAHYLCEMKN